MTTKYNTAKTPYKKKLKLGLILLTAWTPSAFADTHSIDEIVHVTGTSKSPVSFGYEPTNVHWENRDTGEYYRYTSDSYGNAIEQYFNTKTGESRISQRTSYENIPIFPDDMRDSDYYASGGFDDSKRRQEVNIPISGGPIRSGYSESQYYRDMANYVPYYQKSQLNRLKADYHKAVNSPNKDFRAAKSDLDRVYSDLLGAGLKCPLGDVQCSTDIEQMRNHVGRERTKLSSALSQKGSIDREWEFHDLTQRSKEKWLESDLERQQERMQYSISQIISKSSEKLKNQSSSLQKSLDELNTTSESYQNAALLAEYWKEQFEEYYLNEDPLLRVSEEEEHIQALEEELSKKDTLLAQVSEKEQKIKSIENSINVEFDRWEGALRMEKLHQSTLQDTYTRDIEREKESYEESVRYLLSQTQINSANSHAEKLRFISQRDGQILQRKRIYESRVEQLTRQHSNQMDSSRTRLATQEATHYETIAKFYKQLDTAVKDVTNLYANAITTEENRVASMEKSMNLAYDRRLKYQESIDQEAAIELEAVARNTLGGTIEVPRVDLPLVEMHLKSLAQMRAGEGELSIERIDNFVDVLLGGGMHEGSLEPDSNSETFAGYTVSPDQNLVVTLSDVTAYDIGQISDVLDYFEGMTFSESANPFLPEGEFRFSKVDMIDDATGLHFRGRVLARKIASEPYFEGDYKLVRAVYKEGSVNDERLLLAYEGGGEQVLVEANLESLETVQQNLQYTSDGIPIGERLYDIEQVEEIMEHEEVASPSRVRRAASIAVDFMPYAGTFKSFIELASGQDYITGEEVSRVVTVFAMAGSLIPIPGAKHVGKFVGKAVARVRGSTGKTLAKALGINKIRKFMAKAGRQVSPLQREIIEKAQTLSLRAQERLGGHTIARHVGKTFDELAERYANFRGRNPPKLMSSFRTEEEAEMCIREVIEKKAKEIEEWLLSADMADKAFDLPFGKNIGKGVDLDGNRLNNLTSVNVLLRKTDDGFIVLTAYPTN